MRSIPGSLARETDASFGHVLPSTFATVRDRNATVPHGDATSAPHGGFARASARFARVPDAMSEPLLSPGQRRALAWGLVAAVLLTAGGIGWAVVERVRGTAERLVGEAPPQVTHQMVVERLREVSKLVATEMTLRDVVTYEQTRFGSTKQALLVVTGRVAAGVDLERGASVGIDSVSRRITVTLPPAQLLSVDVLNVVTYDERAGLLNPFRAEDRDAIGRRVRSQLMVAARASGILEHADASAARAVEQLLSRDGYTVEIRRPPVQVETRPPG